MNRGLRFDPAYSFFLFLCTQVIMIRAKIASGKFPGADF